jgi:predicted amidohydrolase
MQWGEKKKNMARLLELNEEAAGAGARIILNTELAATGYSFAGREEISALVETIPGPTTRAFGCIAKKHGCYICIGLPEVDRATGVFYNAAVMIGPAGLIGRCRKLSPAYMENLWAARGNLPVLVAQTEFGRLGVLVCADTYSYKPARVAALKGAQLLLVPANWPPEHHNPEKFWRARAAENGVYLLACNRTGIDKDMDFTAAESFIIDSCGVMVKQVSSPGDIIVYGTLPLVGGMLLPAGADGLLRQRRPGCYSDISLDAYSQFSPGMVLGLPEPAGFTIAAVQFRPEPGNVPANIAKLMALIDKAVETAAAEGSELDLAVLPELCTTGTISRRADAEDLGEEIPGATVDMFVRKARDKNICIVLGLVERGKGKQYNSIVLIGPRGVVCKYRKVHLSQQDEGWAEAGESGFPVCDLPFARIGLLSGGDLLFPESAESLAKRGADLICAPALWSDNMRRFIWEARMGEQAHLAVANQWEEAGGLHATGGSAIFGYSRFPEKRLKAEAAAEGDEIIILRLSTADSREKRFLENIDYDTMLNTISIK